MFNRKRIAHLERLLDEERVINRTLLEQVLLLAEKPIMTAIRESDPANVFYMDDARLLEMQEDGDVPT